MTYAGSIGEYGTMQLDGLLGISNPDTYWQAAYDTSKQIIEESGHALYNKVMTNLRTFKIYLQLKIIQKLFSLKFLMKGY